MKHFVTLLFLLITLTAKAQDHPGAAAPDSNTVHINADPRLALIVSKPVQKGRFVGKIRGFRVQIYNGNDRRKANQAKLDFMKNFPGVRSYLVYNNPQFRVRVGDFKTRGEASQLFSKVSQKFNPCMIVPDVVNYAAPKKSTTENTTDADD